MLLGSRTPLPDQSYFNATLYLGITVDDGNPATADVEMRPRQALVPVISAAYAKHAVNSDKLNGFDWSALFDTNIPTGSILGSRIAAGTITSNQVTPHTITASQIAAQTITAGQIAGRTITAAQVATQTITTNELAQAVMDMLVPPGSVIAFAGDTNRIPAGWLLCDGSALSSFAFPRLFSAISSNWGGGFIWNGSAWVKGTNDFNLPDLRGVFLRGTTGSSTNLFADLDREARTNLILGGNSGNNIGSYQQDTFRSHVHQLTDYTWSEATGPFGNLRNLGSNGQEDGDNGPVSGFIHNTESNGGSETRSKNAYVNYIIKF